MMFGWVKKKILKSIINDVKKEIPELKTAALEYLEEHRDELLCKCKEAIKNAIKEFVKDNFDKKV